ncbi:hypothetical protein GCK72_019937 [Caenorhabditis remanei]|uniref:G-protein coupled receptors family 1 profile domain-containing protein n=1 Tax=Caenorhabditis remanei TaxID=31234 RepID=A0A6A5GE66_CAERE|nr:hypothetical protein GCK72_019937 [Caenorhabditis remanei]KAF1753380.1 hypothetical protein GCK72_019937 [Caenorhabditis remanei]
MSEEMDPELLDMITDVLDKLYPLNSFMGLFALLINVPHVIVITRKSMRTNSTNSLMIAIAICDFIDLSVIVYKRVLVIIGLKKFDEAKDHVQLYLALSGVSELLVSVLHPVLALFLYLEIRKSAKNIALISEHVSLERYKSGRMVLFLSVCYMITSCPLGILFLINIYLASHFNLILMMISSYGAYIASTLFCANATAHCIISFVMSSTYRKSAKELFRAEKKRVRM